MSDKETTPVMHHRTPSYGSSGNQADEEVIVPQEAPEAQATAFFETSSYSLFEYCCKGNLTKIIIVLLILTIFFFLCTVVLLTMVIMYASYQFGCEGIVTTTVSPTGLPVTS